MSKHQYNRGFATVTAVIVVVAVGVGGYGIYSQVDQKGSDKPKKELSKSNTDYFKGSPTTTGSVTENKSAENKPASTTGTATEDANKNPRCDSVNCINKKLSNCSSATYTGELDLGSLGGKVSVAYEILGNQSGTCRVRMVYTDNPNTEWENKPLVCDYDTDKPLQAAAQEAMTEALRAGSGANCSGALMEVLPTTSISTDQSPDSSSKQKTGSTSNRRVVGPDGVYAQITSWLIQDNALTDVSYGYKVGHLDSMCSTRHIGGAGSLSAPVNTTEYECQGSTYEIKFYGKNAENHSKPFDIIEK